MTGLRGLFLLLWGAVIVLAALVLWESLLQDSQNISRRVVFLPMVVGTLALAIGSIALTVRRNPSAARYWLVAILVLAGALRLGWALAFPTVPISDFEVNHAIAVDLSQGRVAETFSRNVGYPALLSLAYRIYLDPIAGRLINVIFGTLSVFVVYRLAAAALNPLAGVYSALFMAVSAPEIMMTSVLCTEIVTLTLLLAAAYFLFRSWQEPARLRWIVLAGLCLGTAVLIRPVALVYVLLALIFLVFGLRKARSLKFAGFLGRLLLFLACVAVTHAAVIVWHSAAVGKFSLKSVELATGPYTIITGTNYAADGYYNVDDANLYWSWPAEQRGRRAVELAAQRILANPAQFVELVGIKMDHLLADDTYGLVWSLYPVEDGWTPLQLELIRLRFAVIAQVVYLLTLLAGFYYFLRVPLQKPWLPVFLASVALITVAPHIITEAQPRYHHALLGFLAIAAGCGVTLALRSTPVEAPEPSTRSLNG